MQAAGVITRSKVMPPEVENYTLVEKQPLVKMKQLSVEHQEHTYRTAYHELCSFRSTKS